MTLMDYMKQEDVLVDPIVEEVRRTCKKLNDIVTSVYMGLHSRAFTQLSNLLRGGNSKPALGSSIMMCKLNAREKPLYRMRRMENRKKVNAGSLKQERVEMFEKLMEMCERNKRKNQWE